jgi:hypothetical protein
MTYNHCQTTRRTNQPRRCSPLFIPLHEYHNGVANRGARKGKRRLRYSSCASYLDPCFARQLDLARLQVPAAGPRVLVRAFAHLRLNTSFLHAGCPTLVYVQGCIDIEHARLRTSFSRWASLVYQFLCAHLHPFIHANLLVSFAPTDIAATTILCSPRRPGRVVTGARGRRVCGF